MIVIETFLICDGNCGTNFGVDDRQRNAKQQRKFAARDGWQLIAGKDYCPNCYAKLIRAEGKVVQFKDDKGNICHGIAYDRDQTSDMIELGRIFIIEINDDYTPKIDPSTNQKVVTVRSLDDVKVIEIIERR